MSCKSTVRGVIGYLISLGKDNKSVQKTRLIKDQKVEMFSSCEAAGEAVPHWAQEDPGLRNCGPPKRPT